MESMMQVFRPMLGTLTAKSSWFFVGLLNMSSQPTKSLKKEQIAE
jgi:hypothetical protein